MCVSFPDGGTGEFQVLVQLCVCVCVCVCEEREREIGGGWRGRKADRVLDAFHLLEYITTLDVL